MLLESSRHGGRVSVIWEAQGWARESGGGEGRFEGGRYYQCRRGLQSAGASQRHPDGARNAGGRVQRLWQRVAEAERSASRRVWARAANPTVKHKSNWVCARRNSPSQLRPKVGRALARVRSA